MVSKYDNDVYDLICESFDMMPLSALVDDKYLVMHGGISPELNKVTSLANLSLTTSIRSKDSKRHLLMGCSGRNIFNV